MRAEPGKGDLLMNWGHWAGHIVLFGSALLGEMGVRPLSSQDQTPFQASR